MTTSRVWVMSDPHLCHQFVCGLRGFDTTQEFTDVFVADWESKVKSSDQVWLLGDLTGGGHLDTALAILQTLPGEKHLIIGNHDGCFPDHRDSHRRLKKYYQVFESVQLHARRRINGISCMVSHFPYVGDHTDEARYDQWRLPNYGVPIIHGHTHSSNILSHAPHGTIQINVSWEATKGLVTFDSLHKYLEPHKYIEPFNE